jgi:hypothetical protein
VSVFATGSSPRLERHSDLIAEVRMQQCLSDQGHRAAELADTKRPKLASVTHYSQNIGGKLTKQSVDKLYGLKLYGLPLLDLGFRLSDAIRHNTNIRYRC